MFTFQNIPSHVNKGHISAFRHSNARHILKNLMRDVVVFFCLYIILFSITFQIFALLCPHPHLPHNGVRQKILF